MTSEKIEAFYQTRGAFNDDKRLPLNITNSITEFIAVGPTSEESINDLIKVSIAEFNEVSLEKYGFSIAVSPEVIKALNAEVINRIHTGKFVKTRLERTLNKIAMALEKSNLYWDDDSEFSVNLAANHQGDLEVIVKNDSVDLKVKLMESYKKHPLEEYSVEDLLQLREMLQKNIIGQNDAIIAVESAIRSALGDPDRSRPLSLFLIGSTGTGKTEMGRVIAESFYKSSKRIKIISMGKVKSESGLKNIFGADKGHIGSDSISEFEQALMDNPGGGVIVFDEISNMGGNDKLMKNDLFKYFYDTLEEGVWTSQVTGETYELNKYFFLFTGNDGENVTQNYSSESLKLKAWEEAKGADNVNKILMENGVPEAFLKRTYSVLLKPLLSSEIKEIVRKLLDRQVKKLSKHYNNLKISYDENVLDQIRDAFFSSKDGARGIRDIVEDELPGIILSSLLDTKKNQTFSLSDVHDAEVTLRVEDNRVLGFFLPKIIRPRKVNLIVEFKKNNQILHSHYLDLTNKATEQLLLDQDYALSTAIHEAGHAVANDPEISNSETDFISILPGRFFDGEKEVNFAGVASTSKTRHYSISDRKFVVHRLSVLAGGYMAQRLAGQKYGIKKYMRGFDANLGANNDIDKMRVLAKHAILGGLDPEFYAIALDKDGNPVLSEKKALLLEEKIQELFSEAEKQCEKRLNERWHLVVQIARELMKKGDIGKHRFKVLEKWSEQRTMLKKKIEGPQKRYGSCYRHYIVK